MFSSLKRPVRLRAPRRPPTQWVTVAIFPAVKCLESEADPYSSHEKNSGRIAGVSLHPSKNSRRKLEISRFLRIFSL